MTQEELAERAGLSTNAICALECGKRYPRPRTVAVISAALGVSASELLLADPKGERQAIVELTKLMRAESDATIQLVIELAKVVVRKGVLAR